MGYKIKRAREEKGFSQEKLAELLGGSRQTISGLESAAITVTTTVTLFKIARALDKKVGEIFWEWPSSILGKNDCKTEDCLIERRK